MSHMPEPRTSLKRKSRNTWTMADEVHARAQGWFVTESAGIQRDMNVPWSEGNIDVAVVVRLKAKAGDLVAWKALRLHRKWARQVDKDAPQGWWNPLDEYAALMQGWRFNRGFGIEPQPGLQDFNDAEQAIAFVRTQAELGNLHAAKAVRLHDEAVERDRRWLAAREAKLAQTESSNELVFAEGQHAEREGVVIRPAYLAS